MAPADFEAEVIAGLEPFAVRELEGIGGALVSPAALTRRSSASPGGGSLQGGQAGSGGSGYLRFRFGGPWARLLELRTVVAVHVVVAAGLPRPSALLDDGTFKRLAGTIGHIRSLHPSGTFGSVRLSGAGADSPTFRRVRERLAQGSGLRDVGEGGDLLLRFKRVGADLGGPGAAAGAVREPPRRTPRIPGNPMAGVAVPNAYELTARISPRPLAARAWRVCNLPGALNATVASAMAGLTEPHADDVYLNLLCGSGTLLIERAALGPAGRLLGCDVDPEALACAAENVAAAGLEVELQPWDATAVPLPDASASAIVADLPFGQLVGSHRANEQLYPALLAEAARLARPAARFVAITQQVVLFERCLRDAAGPWATEGGVRLDIPANRGVLKPRVYVLGRRRAD